MEIRKYEDTDEKSVIELWEAVLHDPAPHNDPALSIRRKLAFERDLFLVAASDGEIAGTIMGGYDGHRGWIYSLAVRPDFQKQGIAAALLKRIEEKFNELDCPKINLQVRAGNKEVTAFYEKAGYKVEERISMGKRLY